MNNIGGLGPDLGKVMRKKTKDRAEQSLDNLSEFIPLEDCKHGWLYRIRSRNLNLGVFRKDWSGFVGIREKFGYEYLFVESHWDTGEPHGTVKPLDALQRCSIANLDEDVLDESEKYETNKELFEWLSEKEAQYIEKRKLSIRKGKRDFVVVHGGHRKD